MAKSLTVYNLYTGEPKEIQPLQFLRDGHLEQIHQLMDDRKVNTFDRDQLFIVDDNLSLSGVGVVVFHALWYDKGMDDTTFNALRKEFSVYELPKHYSPYMLKFASNNQNNVTQQREESRLSDPV